MAVNYEQLVRDQYAKIGRVGLGEGVDQIDYAGLEYWTDQLESGAIPTDQLGITFDNAVDEYMELYPDDEYTQYARNYLSGQTEDNQITIGGGGQNVSLGDTNQDSVTINDEDTTKQYTVDITLPSQEEAQQLVEQVYGTIGRSGVGDAPNQIDPAGLEYWTNELISGRISTDMLPSTFSNAVDEYTTTYPDDEYTQYYLSWKEEQDAYTPEEQARYDQANSLYTLMFGRPLREEGAEYWVRGGGAGVPLTYLQILESAGAEDKERFEGIVRQKVLDQYAGVGRTGFGTAPNQIDQAGYDYYVDQLLSGQITLNNLPAVFRSAVDEYIAENPDDEYSDTMKDYLSQPRESTTGAIVAGVPQAGEVGVVEYMGLQAGEPTLPTGTKLSGQLEELDAEAVGTELGDISTADKTKLDTETDAILSSEIEKVGSMVEGTYTVPGQVTIPSSEGITTDLVTESEFTEAGVPSEFIDPVTGKLRTDENLATMTAKKSYTDIDDEAIAFTAAKQELAEVDPLATVTGQLAILQKQFDDGNVPVWAQGAFRQVNALMAQRGIGGSTMAAEAITNALMQSAIPIAQQDASFYQNVTLQNLSNEQQAEMAKFNARTASIFNDQAAVNAARNLNTQSENELTQFFAQLATNVSVTNAEMSNAMEQFNATAENQMTQFFEELELTAETFNADAVNELAQFDAEQANIIAQFNSSMKDQRERFNVQNQLAIDASNVNWRRDVNTANTSATNAALQFDAQNLLGIQQTALNNIWQHYDTMLNFVFQSEESGKDRAQQLIIATMTEEMRAAAAESAADTSLISDAFNAAATFAGTKSGSSAIEKWFGLGDRR